MTDLTLTELRDRLDRLLAAETKILANQSYQIGDRRLQRASLAEVTASIESVRAEIRLRESGARAGGRVLRGVPR